MSAEERRPEPAPARGRGPLEAKVFLVEDDAVVRKVIVRILERAGAEVDGVEDAEAALEAFRQGLDVDVVITDMGLPGMKGSALIGEIQEHLPGIPVVAISGYPKGALMSDYDLPPDIPVLSKPFTPDELLTLIRTLLTAEGRFRDSSGS